MDRCRNHRNGLPSPQCALPRPPPSHRYRLQRLLGTLLGAYRCLLGTLLLGTLLLLGARCLLGTLLPCLCLCIRAHTRPYHDRTMVHASAPLCCCVDAVRGHPFNMNKPHMSLYYHPLPLLTLIFPLLTPYPFTRSPFLSIPSSSSLPLRPFLPIPSLPSFPYYNPPGLGETFVIPPLPLRRRRHRDKRQPPPQRPSEGGPL